MSRIDELIQKLCPSGVEYVTLLELLGSIPRGRRLTKAALAEDGQVPVYHGGLEPIGFHDQSNSRAMTVMVINTGASSGTVGWSEVPFWCSDGCFALPHSERVESKYLYYFALSNQKFFTDRVRRAGIPTLAADSVLSLRIPVPPLEVQREIVRILDKFTQLEAELEAELEARRAQYELYRRALLGAEERDSLQPLGKLLISVRVPKGVKRGAYGDGSAIPIVDQGKSAIAGFTDDDSFRVPAGEHIVFGDHTRAVKWVDHDFAPGADGTRVFRAREGVLPRYAFFAFQQLEIPSRGYNRHWTVAREMTVPVPSLKRQREIVTILDQFDALVNDISIGLPAELTARRKQYEYYRDRLLTFKELTA